VVPGLALVVEVREHLHMSAFVPIGKAKLELCDFVEQARRGQTHIMSKGRPNWRQESPYV
jgi:hypothetical protein